MSLLQGEIYKNRATARLEKGVRVHWSCTDCSAPSGNLVRLWTFGIGARASGQGTFIVRKYKVDGTIE